MDSVESKFVVLSMLLIVIPIVMLLSLYSWDIYRNIIFEINGQLIVGFNGVVQTVIALITYFTVCTIGMYKVIYNSFYKANEVDENLKISEEEYRIIMSQKDDIIFQWNVLEDTIFYSDNWWNKFNYNPITTNILEDMRKTKKIHEEDLNRFYQLIDGISDKSVYKESEIRIMTSDGQFKWFKITITGVFDDHGKLIKAVGTIIDIDNEKKEIEELLCRVQRDGLTKLYNKDTIEKIIKSEICKKAYNSSKALLIIDIDDFKNVNDSFGHLNGDYALKLAADNLKCTFKEDAYIGRIGGDEFVVFLNEVIDSNQIIKNVEHLIEKFAVTSIGNNKEFKLSCSIGIAQNFNTDMTYEEFFEKADKSLYKAKEKGKNTYHLLK